MDNSPVGIFDSGIGGLSVARAIIGLLPLERLRYFGDTARIPYGSKPAATILSYSISISKYLIEDLGCKAVVLACNTASAAALPQLRQTWPHIPFIGMEPAVKPGAAATKTGVVGVLATAGTFQSQRYAGLMARFAQHIQLLENPCTGLVELIEAGQLDSRSTRQLLESILHPMMEQGADTFVLGCTHYPFVQPLIQDIIGPGRFVINPAPAVARQLRHILEEHGLLAAHTVPHPPIIEVSGRPEQAQPLTDYMLGPGHLVMQAPNKAGHL